MSDRRPSTDWNELPGMLAVAKGVAEQTFPHTMDAAVWAAEFVKLNPGADEGTMIGWFANAIMAGYDTARARAPDLLRPLEQCVRQLEIVLPVTGRVHDERQALIDAYAAIAKARA